MQVEDGVVLKLMTVRHWLDFPVFLRPSLPAEKGGGRVGTLLITSA